MCQIDVNFDFFAFLVFFPFRGFVWISWSSSWPTEAAASVLCLLATSFVLAIVPAAPAAVAVGVAEELERDSFLLQPRHVPHRASLVPLHEELLQHLPCPPSFGLLLLGAPSKPSSPVGRRSRSEFGPPAPSPARLGLGKCQ